MPVFQRIRDAVSASIESLLDSVENREAVARAQIDEEQARVARAREQVRALRGRIEQAELTTRKLEQERSMWRARAQGLGHDRERGLACVRRMREVARAQERVVDELQRLRVEVDGLEDAQRRAASAASHAEVSPRRALCAATDMQEEASVRAEFDRLLGIDR